ncbi:MAG: ArnT family glycosyltransferase [Bacteroidia bacterium]
MKAQKLIASIFILISLHCFYKYTGVYDNIHKRPCSVHSWAQCERASIALNFYQVDMNFFKPRIHKVLDGEGITGLEFPFVNYSAAILYKLFGFNEMYYRLFVMLTLVFGLVLFNLLCYSVTKSYLLALAAVASAALSPILLFYTANFLPDTTSLGFVLAAWYFFYRYLETGRQQKLILFFVFALLAALIKITSIIVFCVLIGLVVLDYMKFFHKTRQNLPLFANKLKVLGLSLLGMALVFAWYKYAQWLSDTYHSDAFLLKQNLVTTKKEMSEIWKVVKETWVPHYYAQETYTLIVCVAFSFLIGFKYVSRLLFTITFLTLMGSCCFVFLMLVQFRNHDYYIITLLPFVFLLMLTFVDMVVKLADNFFPPLKFIVLVIIFFNAKECILWNKESFSLRYDAVSYSYTGDFRPYEDLEPKLRAMGIKRTDVTMSAYDFSFCNSLYLMNQMGWTIDKEFTPDFVKWMMEKTQPQYLVLSDTALFNKTYPNNFKDKIIGYHRGLFIYKLK